MLADVHSLSSFYVPLKTLSRQYEMYKMVVSPTRILNNMYVQFDIGRFWDKLTATILFDLNRNGCCEM